MDKSSSCRDLGGSGRAEQCPGIIAAACWPKRDEQDDETEDAEHNANDRQHAPDRNNQDSAMTGNLIMPTILPDGAAKS
jgi:hypothetical protein